jgi:phage tail tube protein FII
MADYSFKLIRPSIKINIFVEKLRSKIKTNCKFEDVEQKTLATIKKDCFKFVFKQLDDRKNHLEQVTVGLAQFIKEIQEIAKDDEKAKTKVI